MLKIIFSYIDEKEKLEIIKCNKFLQNKLSINIINYKFFAQKYIVHEKNNKGKVYDGQLDTLIFGGEFLNGKKNGKGKEYLGDTLFFEGEYLNGKRNGKGKKFFDEELSFEGEYLNGKRNGKGILLFYW